MSVRAMPMNIALSPSMNLRSTVPTLGAGEVHVWHATLESPGLNISSVTQLSDRERNRAARLRFRKDFDRFVASHVLLRTILARYLDIDPDQIDFSYGAHGKPALSKPFENALKFSMSRSRGRVLYAIAAEFEVGVDIEHVVTKPEDEQLAAPFFSPRESEYIQCFSGDVKSKAFLDCWVSKEAYLKATGEGLSRPLNSFEVSFSGNPVLIGTETEGLPSSLWSLNPLYGFPRYAAALVAEKQCQLISQFMWPATHRVM